MVRPIQREPEGEGLRGRGYRGGVGGDRRACYVLARRAITDVATLLIALVALGIVWRFKLPEPALIAAGGATGLPIFWIRG